MIHKKTMGLIVASALVTLSLPGCAETGGPVMVEPTPAPAVESHAESSAPAVESQTEFPAAETPEAQETPAGQAAESLGSVTVSFHFERQTGYASNQFAVWVEDSDGNYVDTLCATDFTARGGYKNRPNSLIKWVERSGLGAMDNEQVDAISSATPGTGDMAYVWDCVDASGSAVAEGTYTIYVEGTLRDVNSVIYSAPVEIGGDQQQVAATAEYTGESDAEHGMLGDVTVSYTP